MESQPQNPEFRNNPENIHPCELIENKLTNLPYYKIIVTSSKLRAFIISPSCRTTWRSISMTQCLNQLTPLSEN